MLRQSAGWLAGRDGLPTSVRAVLGYYADSGVFDYGSLSLRRRVDATVEEIIDDAFAAVEAAIADEFDRESVDFAYDTKLVMPAELTLGYLYRRLDEDDHDHAEAVTRLVIEALIDGDMRDAVNDDEFEDFEVDFPVDGDERRRVAELAQATLQDRVEAEFSDYPDAVREAYEWAVGVSEAHQAEDDYFRELMAAAQSDSDASGGGPGPGDDAGGTGGDAVGDTADATAAVGASEGDAVLAPAQARERIREEYKHADFEEPPAIFDTEERDLPYLKTQYDRVGVIYSGMIRMYREADLPVEDAFEKSIVLAIVGAQIWLDDIDDFAADMVEGQLTPVTAEYLLAEDGDAAAAAVVAVSERYLDLARDHATAVDSTLTGIATEYIYRSGDPDALPR